MIRDPEEGLVWQRTPGYILARAAETATNYTPDLAKHLSESKVPFCDTKARANGVLLVLTSTIGFSLASVLVKIDYHLDRNGFPTPFPTVEIATLRALVSFILSCITLKAANLDFVPRVSRRTMCIIVLRGVLDFVASNLFYIGCTQLPIAVATVIYFTNPFWAGVLARATLGESYGLNQVAITCVAACGVIISLLSDLHFHVQLGALKNLSHYGVWCAAVGSVFQAGQYVAGRAICGEGVHWLHSNVAYSIAGLVLGPVAMCLNSQMGFTSQSFLAPWDWSSGECFATIGVVVCAVFSQVTLIGGLSVIPATTTALIRTLDIPMTFGWAVLLLGEVPNRCEVVGAVILMTACAMLLNARD